MNARHDNIALAPLLAQTISWPPAADALVMASAGTHSRFSDDVWDLTALPGSRGNWTKRLDFSRLADHGITHPETAAELKEVVYFVLHEERSQLPAANTFLLKYY